MRIVSTYWLRVCIPIYRTVKNHIKIGRFRCFNMQMMIRFWVLALLAVSGNQAANADNINSYQAAVGISASDRQNIAHYGACAAIKKMIVTLARAQVDQNPTLELYTGMAARQASLYTILVSEIAEKYDASQKEEVVAISNSFVKDYVDSHIGQQLSGKTVKDMNAKARCDDDYPWDDARRIMETRKAAFDHFTDQLLGR